MENERQPVKGGVVLQEGREQAMPLTDQTKLCLFTISESIE